MENAQNANDETIVLNKQSAEERMENTINRIEDNSSAENYSNTADMVVGATLTEWQFSPDGSMSMFQPLNESEIQNRLQKSRILARRFYTDSSQEDFEARKADDFRKLKEILQHDFAILRSGELPISDDKKMIFENVIIDHNNLGINKVVGGKVKVVKKNGEQFTTDAKNDNVEGQNPDELDINFDDSVLTLQFTDRQLGSPACDYPKYEFNGNNLNNLITSDHCPAMAMLAKKWKEAMLLYPQATLDLHERQNAQRQQEILKIENDVRQSLVEIGLADF